MVYANNIGNTGMTVSSLGLDASPLGDVYQSILEADGIRAVLTAVPLGINFIDLPPYRGHLNAETVLAKALRQLRREHYILSTKVGCYGKNGVNRWDYSAKQAIECVYDSMIRLNADYIDLVSVHNVEFADLHQVVEETLPALVGLREEGVVRHIGITSHHPEDLKRVIDHCEPGTVECVTCHGHYCLSDDLLLDYLDFFEERGIGVVNTSPLAMGLFSKNGIPEGHPAPPALKEACTRAAAYCAEKRYSIERLAIEYATRLNPRIATTLISCANRKNVTLRIIQTNEQYIEKEKMEEMLRDVRAIIGDQLRVRYPFHDSPNEITTDNRI